MFAIFDESQRCHSLAVGLVLGAALSSTWVLAANNPDRVGALARYQVERSACLNGQSNQDRPTCLREANAAFAEAKRGGLDDGPVDYHANALKRCEPLRGDDRQACIARMNGEGTTSGSVAGGGIYRELVTRKVGSPDEAL